MSRGMMSKNSSLNMVLSKFLEDGRMLGIPTLMGWSLDHSWWQPKWNSFSWSLTGCYLHRQKKRLPCQERS